VKALVSHSLDTGSPAENLIIVFVRAIFFFYIISRAGKIRTLNGIFAKHDAIRRITSRIENQTISVALVLYQMTMMRGIFK
jgi:hypothetical protein